MKEEEVRYDGGLFRDEIVREIVEAALARETLIFVLFIILQVMLVLALTSVQVMLPVGVM